jgi:hypothetical protein
MNAIALAALRLAVLALLPALALGLDAPAGPAADPSPAVAIGTATRAPLRDLPVDLSLVPPISLNGEGRVRNHLSLGLAIARSTVLQGLALAPVHLAEEDVDGAQVTWIAASAGGRVRGVQLAYITSVAGQLQGVQLTTVVNVLRGAGAGAQLASMVNVATARVTGFQASGAFNYAGEVVGAQASCVNLTSLTRGAQLAVVNVGGDVTGAQVGLVNVARRVKGLQLGVLNLADDADASVGVLSLVRSGRHDLELYVTEITTFNLAARLGGRTVHGLLVAGIQPGAQHPIGGTRWAAGLGVGTGAAIGHGLDLDADLLAQRVLHDWTTPHNVLVTARVLLGWRATPWIAIFGGPTASLFLSDDIRADLHHLGWKVNARTDSRAWVGFVAGLRI